MNALDWLRALPPAVASQREVLARLLERIQKDACWRWLAVGCSLAEGRGDELSDLDLGLGIADDDWEAGVTKLRGLLEGLGPVVGALYHRLPEMGSQTHVRAFVQYANGVQIDLVAVPARMPRGHAPEHVVLYDPDNLLGEPWDSAVLQATPELVYEWAFLGWIALADLLKYGRRGSCWEALERLERARTQVWRLWAVAHRLRYPGFGVTTVLDHPEVPLPPGIEATTAHAAGADIDQAARAVAHLLVETSRAAADVLGAALPDALAAHVGRQIEQEGSNLSHSGVRNRD